MPLSDSSKTCIRVVRLAPSPAGLLLAQASPRSPGSRAGSVWACLGSTTTQVGPELALASPVPVAFRPSESVGVLILRVFEAQYPAHLFPCLRFAARLAAPSAKLGAEWIATPFS
jgi:hypothetical protein